MPPALPGGGYFKVVFDDVAQKIAWFGGIFVNGRSHPFILEVTTKMCGSADLCFAVLAPNFHARCADELSVYACRNFREGEAHGVIFGWGNQVLHRVCSTRWRVNRFRVRILESQRPRLLSCMRINFSET